MTAALLQRRNEVAYLGMKPTKDEITFDFRSYCDLRDIGFINNKQTIHLLMTNYRKVLEHSEAKYRIIVKNDQHNNDSCISILTDPDHIPEKGNDWSLTRARASSSFFVIKEKLQYINDKYVITTPDWSIFRKKRINLEQTKYKALTLSLVLPSICLLAVPFAQNLPENHECFVKKRGLYSDKYMFDFPLNSTFWGCFIAACSLYDAIIAGSNDFFMDDDNKYCPPHGYGSSLRTVMYQIIDAKVGDYLLQRSLIESDIDTNILEEDAKTYRKELMKKRHQMISEEERNLAESIVKNATISDTNIITREFTFGESCWNNGLFIKD